MQNILEIQNLSVPLPTGGDRKYALKNVYLSLPRGQLTCIVGESGSGKSTLARAIMGLLQLQRLAPSEGRILLDGEDVINATDKRMRELRGNVMSMIFQEPMSAMNPVMRVGAQAEEVLRYHGVQSKEERRKRVLDAFTEVNLPQPAETYQKYPHQLSGGQRQRVMIAMALLLGPKLLIADEPTTALDVTTQMRILRLLKKQQQEKDMSMLFVTHDFGVVAEIADSVVVMRYGEIVESGPAAEVLSAPRHEYTRALLRDLAEEGPGRTSHAGGRPVLDVSGLRKSYALRPSFGFRSLKRTVLEDFSLELRPGETVAVVGESGSGKSTVARCLSRLVEPDNGRVVIAGEDFLQVSGKALRNFRSHIQMIFQDPYSSLNPRTPAGAIVSQPAIARGVPKAEAWENGCRALEIVGLDRSAAKRLPHEFSGGQRQRIGIARALSLKPSILIADEAVSALDISTQTQIIRLFEELQAQFQIAIIFITHDLRVAQKIAHKIIVMQSGKVVEQGDAAELFQNPKHPYTQELLASVPGRAWWNRQRNRRTSSAGERSSELGCSSV
uniref:dipeptide ABC transporter ATP-binding protein n=1 Tax=Ensifer adhaerens TaxID=106592 RepID=UPI003F495B79